MMGRKKAMETERKQRFWRNGFGLVVLAAGSLLFTGCAGEEEEWKQLIVEEEIEIEGISGQYELLFLTDTHIIVMDEADVDRIEDNARSRLSLFRNREGISSAGQFDEWIKFANNEELDGLLLGGDIIDYPSRANITYLEGQLEKLTMPYLYALGNHDWTYPWEYMTEWGEDTYLPLLEPYMKGESAIHTQDFGEFLVVAVDNSGNQINEEVLPVYEEVLKEGKPVIVMAHVPFLTQSVLTKAKKAWTQPVVIGGGNYGGIYPDETSQKFIDMTTAADSPVALVLAGHVHFYDKDYMEGEKKVLQIVGDAGYGGNAVLLHIR